MQWKKHISERRWMVQHERLEDFYLSCWQRGSSPAPLLFLRVFKLSFTLWVWGWSLVSFWGPLAEWFIYMTHWGITVIAIQSLLGVYKSVKAYRHTLPDPSFGLPWYVKTYWVLFNISTPVAFLITLFYWVVLYGSDIEIDYAPNIVLDISLHGLNSVVMLVELAVAGHPSRLLHVYQPVGFGLIYLIFGVIYYHAGGLDPFGNQWIYPVIDWSKPATTAGVVAATTVVLFLLHFFVVGLAQLRDFLARRILRKEHISSGISNDAFVAA